MISLSLFNGMSFGSMALEALGVKVDKMYSSEIDKHANKATQALYPETIQLGCIKRWREWDIDFSEVDLLLAGYPCQSWSIAGSGGGDKDPRGELIHDLIDIWNEIKKVNPNLKFMFECTKMEKEHFDYVNSLFGFEPVLINGALVAPQNRARNYWTSAYELDQPKDTGSLLIDILEDLPDCPIGYRVREKSCCVRVGGRNSPLGSKQCWEHPFQRITKKGTLKPGTDKAACLTAGAHSGGNHSDMDIIHTPNVTRRYSVRECARLQTMPEEKIDILLSLGISSTQLYKMIANGWVHNKIVHILRIVLDITPEGKV